MDSMSNPFLGWVDSVIEKAAANKTKVLVGFVAVVGLGIGYVGYRWYNQKAQVEAHKDFMQALTAFDTPIRGMSRQPVEAEFYFATEEEKWKKVEDRFRRGVQEHSSSGLSSMFKLFLAETLLNQNKLDEAIDVMKSAVNGIQNDKLKEYYLVKCSLMQLDSARPEIVAEGLEKLKSIALNQNNSAQGQALFNLGLYFWVTKNIDEAKNYWQQFLVKFGNESGFEEQIRVAKSKLELIAV